MCVCVKEYEKEGNEIEGEGGGEDEVGVGELVGLLEAWSYFHCVNITTKLLLLLLLLFFLHLILGVVVVLLMKVMTVMRDER